MGSTSSIRSSRAPAAWTFFEPGQFHGQLPDLAFKPFDDELRLDRFEGRTMPDLGAVTVFSTYAYSRVVNQASTS